MKNNTKEGFVLIFVVILIAVVIAFLGFYIYLNKAKDIVSTTPLPTYAPLSSSSDTKSIEEELDKTDLGDPDSDINSLNTSADSL